LWYVIPLGALLAGRPALEIAIYGGYGLVRGGAVWALLWWSLRNGDTAPIRRSLLERAAVARARASGQLLAVGIAVALALGL